MRCEWFFNDVYAKYRVISITNNTMLETIMKFKLDLHNGCSLPGIRESFNVANIWTPFL